MVAGLGGRPITEALAARLLDDALDGPARALTFLDLDRELVERELERIQTTGRPGRTPRTCCATRDRRRARHWRPMPYQQIKFYQAGSFVVGNRLLDPDAALGPGRRAALQLAHLRATAPARAAARRSAPATRSTPRCAPPTAS